VGGRRRSSCILGEFANSSSGLCASVRDDELTLRLVCSLQKRIIARERIGDRFVFETEFVSSRWNDTTQTHTVTLRDLKTSKTLEVTANVLISATGALNKPITPRVPGIETFKGIQFHSSRWRSDVDLRHKRVAIVGNGSSGIQATANIVELEGIRVTNLYVLQLEVSENELTQFRSVSRIAFVLLATFVQSRTLLTPGGSVSSSSGSRTLFASIDGRYLSTSECLFSLAAPLKTTN
jgi:hypothetical protein